jgi:hypothetical protein
MSFSALASARRRAALLLATVGVMLVFAGSAQPAQALEVGVNDDSVLLYQQYYPRLQLIQQARTMGATWIRVNFTYADYASQGYKYLDALRSTAAANGMSIHLTLTGTPAGYKGAKKTKAISYFKPSPKAFAKWVKTVAKHYKGKIRRYALWNEGQFPEFLSSKSNPKSRGATSRNPAMYCALYKAGRAAIKSVDRKNKVLWGELAPLRDPIGFIKKAACRGTGKVDGLAFHPYALKPGAVGIGSTPAIKKAAKKYLKTSNLYYTEFGFIRSPLAYGKPDSQRATLTVDGYKYARKQGIKNLTYYILVQPPPKFFIAFDSGIIRSDGTPTPVYTALCRYLTGRC